MNYLLVFIGGGVGSVLRLILSSNVAAKMGSGFPWGTLAVNIIGAAMIGLLAELLALKYAASTPTRYLLVTGVLGGFTTFSAFSLETSLMWMRHDYGLAAMYITASVVGTMIACLGVMHLMRGIL